MSIDRYCIHCQHAITHTPIVYCAISKQLDLVTGEEYLIPASVCREYERHCGQRAVNFVSRYGDNHG